MARMSPEERKRMEDALAEDDAQDDEDDEVSLTFPDGHSFTGSYRRAKAVAEARGFKLSPDPKPEGDGKTGSSGASNVKRFQSGRRVS